MNDPRASKLSVACSSVSVTSEYQNGDEDELRTEKISGYEQSRISTMSVSLRFQYAAAIPTGTSARTSPGSGCEDIAKDPPLTVVSSVENMNGKRLERLYLLMTSLAKSTPSLTWPSLRMPLGASRMNSYASPRILRMVLDI